MIALFSDFREHCTFYRLHQSWHLDKWLLTSDFPLTMHKSRSLPMESHVILCKSWEERKINEWFHGIFWKINKYFFLLICCWSLSFLSKISARASLNQFCIILFDNESPSSHPPISWFVLDENVLQNSF